jgi:hypothetical protein
MALDHVVSELLQSLECQSTVVVVLAGFVTASEERAIGLVPSILNTVVVPDMLAEVIFALEAIAASVTTRELKISQRPQNFSGVEITYLPRQTKDQVTTYFRQ